MKLNLPALLLAVCIVLCCLTGCGGEKTSPPNSGALTETAAPGPEAAEIPAAAEETGAPAGADELWDKYAAAYAKYDPDTVVMRINGVEIPWSEYFFWIYTTARQLETSYGVTDWSQTVPELENYLEDPSYGAYVLMYAETNAIQSTVIEEKAKESGALLTAAQQQSLDEDVAGYIENLGGEDAFRETLRSMFLTRDYLERQNALPLLYSNLEEAFFGTQGELLSEEDVVAYLTDNGYLHAKHILFKTVDDNRNPLDEATVAAQRARAEEVLATLQDVSPDELEIAFDAMMKEYSEDPGSFSFPNGYYFTAGQMVPSFENAVRALEENGLSDLVESEYGFHIIYRPAMRADDLMDYDSGNQAYSPRAVAADELFYNMAVSWYDDAVIEYSPDFEDLHLNDLLPVALEER